MIHVIDNYLPKEVFEDLQLYCEHTPFEEVDMGGKKFSALKVPENILEFIHLDGYRLNLTFIRRSYKGFDNELRVHADNIINGYYTDMALVMYINKSEGVIKNGTRFHEHHYYGQTLPRDISPFKFDELLTNDANDPNVWTTTDIITARPNRLLMYSANQFHSKFPSEIEHGTRIVLVAFYSEIKE